jgi:Ca2+/Na+ antiporter
VTAFVAGGAGFLLAVLWFDLMFDVQVLRRAPAGAPDEAVASISAYYGRVTSTAMSRLVGAVMLATLAAIVVQIVRGPVVAWTGWTSLALAACAVGVAAVHTLPSARRLGAWPDDAATRLRLARSICRDHLLCLTAIAALLVVQLGFGT